MTTYERITYHPEGGRSRTIYLIDPTEGGSREGVLGSFIAGVEVDREGMELAPKGIDERRHIISLDLVTKRTRMVMDNTYGELMEA